METAAAIAGFAVACMTAWVVLPAMLTVTAAASTAEKNDFVPDWLFLAAVGACGLGGRQSARSVP